MLRFQSVKRTLRRLQIMIPLVLGVFALTSAVAQTISTDDLSLPDVRGGTFHLSDHHPHLTLVAFLSLVPDTVSTPALRETVFLSSMEQQYAARGLCVVGIDTSHRHSRGYVTQQDIANASADWHINFPILDDADDDRLWRRLGALHDPAIFLIDESGRVVSSWSGYTRPAILAQAIESVLGGPLSRLPKLHETGK